MSIEAPNRTPSPPPPPPIPSTPGPLASRLSQLYEQALTHLLRTHSYSNFASCFPTPAARKPEVLRSVWKQINDKIEERGRVEFESILRERDVIAGLNELERLVGEAKTRKASGQGGQIPTAPHTFDPQSLYLAHLSPYLQQVERELEGKLGETQAQNKVLGEEIRKQREEVEDMVGGLEAIMRDLEGANQVLGECVGDGIDEEILEMDVDIEGKTGRAARL